MGITPLHPQSHETCITHGTPWRCVAYWAFDTAHISRQNTISFLTRDTCVFCMCLSHLKINTFGHNTQQQFCFISPSYFSTVSICIDICAKSICVAFVRVSVSDSAPQGAVSFRDRLGICVEMTQFATFVYLCLSIAALPSCHVSS